ncbi:MAG: PAS domain S-box protein [Geobacter sp.]|nr:PAS domain S-box protein [Geobacter sp.]
MRHSCSIAGIISWLAGIVTVLLVLVYPLVYFFISYNHAAGEVESEVELLANSITQQVVSVNPDLWQFGQTRLEEYLTYLLRDAGIEKRRILNNRDETVANISSGQVTQPLIIRSYPLNDSGVVVGRIEITRSLRPTLNKTGMIFLVVLPFGAATYGIFRILPVRAIKRMEAELHKANAELELKVQERTAALDETNRELQQEIITRKQQEAALIASEERFRALVETMCDWVWAIDGKGTYVYSSPRVREMLGLTPEEMIGKSILEFMHEDEAERVTALIEKFTAKPEPFTSIETLHHHKDGRLVILESSGVPFFAADGTLKGYRGIDRDITWRKQAEREREQLIVELQEAIANVKTLSGLIPICAGCKKIRDDKGYWSQLETYISEHADVLFSHGYCPDCYAKVYEEIENIKSNKVPW